MAEIIRNRERVESEHFQLFFSWTGEKGRGFSFPCDADGKVNVSELCPEAVENYNRCIDGRNVVDEPVVQTFRNNYTEPALLKCDCGAELELADCMTNECEQCNAFYNGSGQRLAHPSQWGEETGERFDGHGRYIGGGEVDDLMF